MTNHVVNPIMPPTNWCINPNLRQLGPDDDDVMEAPHAELAEPDYQDWEEAQNLEALAQKYEENMEMRKRERWPGQERWQGRENEEMRLVNILHPYAFMRRLQRVGIDARIEYSKCARLWLNLSPRLGRLGVSAWVKPEDGIGPMLLRTVTTLQDGAGPEWSLMHFNRYNVPTSERYRGWRTALLHLIIANVITEDEAHSAFGQPTHNAASEFYRQQLQSNRHRRLGLQR